MTRAARSAFWLVVFAWVAVWPLLGTFTGVLWEAHLTAVILAALCAVPVLWSMPRVRIGPPVLAVVAALLSMGLAVSANGGAFSGASMEDAAAVGTAHALFFLLCLGMAPDRVDDPDAEHRRGEAFTRGALAATFAVLALGQVVMMLLGQGADDPSGRPAGTLGNPNALGALLAASALALAALAGWRPWTWALVAVLAFAVLATRSRGAVAAGGLVLLVFLWRRLGWKALAVAAVGAALLLLVPNPLRERALQLQTDHAYSRPFLWGTAASILLEHPAGLGPGNYGAVFPAHALHPEFPWLLHQRHAVGLTHNVFLTIGTEWGWAALGAVLLLTGWAAARLWRRSGCDPLRQGALLGAAVLFVEMQVDGTEQNRVVFSAFLLLLAVALARVARPTEGWRVAGRWAALATILVVLDLGTELGRFTAARATIGALDELVAAHGRGEAATDAVREALHDATLAHIDDHRIPARSHAFEAARVRADLAAYRAALAAAADLPSDGGPDGPLDERAEVTRARAALRRSLGKVHLAEFFAVRKSHENLDVRRRAAHLHRALMRAEEASGEAWPQEPPGVEHRSRSVELLEQLLAVDPLDVDARFLLVQWAHEDGDPDGRDAGLDALFALEPDHPWAWFWAARLAEAEGRDEAALHAYVRAEEAVGGARLKAQVDNPRSRRFFEASLARVDLARIREGIVRLRRTVYF